MSDMDMLTSLLGGLGIFATVISAVISVGLYVLYGISHMKAFKMMGYKNAWAAWIPFYSSYVLADCIPETKGNVNMFGLSIPGNLFKFWWVVSFVIGYVPVVGGILSIVVNILCAGYCYISIYSILENKPQEEVRAVGYVSGWLNIIASVKFLMYK